jgi:hypothetical protein
VERGAFSPGSGRMGRLGFFASTPFFFDCFSSFLYLAEFFLGAKKRSQRGFRKDSKQVANILKA